MDSRKDTKHDEQSPGITSSTESETFETWTLLSPDVQPEKASKTSTVQEAKVLEDDKIIKEHMSDQKPPSLDGNRPIEKKDEAHTDGEMSDGISIISDSESGGRSSPQPAPRRLSPTKRNSLPKLTVQSDHGNDSDNTDETNETADQNSDYEPITPPNTPAEAVIKNISKPVGVESIVTQSSDEHDNDSTDSEIERSIFPGFNYSYAFLIAVFVAFLAMYGRIRVSETDGDRMLRPYESRLESIFEKCANIEEHMKKIEKWAEEKHIDSNDQYEILMLYMRKMDEAIAEIKKLGKCPLNNEKIDNGPQNAEIATDSKYKTQAENPLNVETIHGGGRLPNAADQENFAPRESPRRRPPQEKFNNKKFNKEKPMHKPDDLEALKESNNKKRREPRHKNDREQSEQHKAGRNEQYEGSGQYKPRHKNDREQHDQHKTGRKEQYEGSGQYKLNSNNNREGRYKSAGKEKNQRGSNSQYKNEGREMNSGERDEQHWMDRRRRYREEARKNEDGVFVKSRQPNDDSNWYLERGTGRQKARKFDTVDGDRA